MQRILLKIALVVISYIVVSCSTQENPREQIRFTKDWRFTLADSSLFAEINYDDSQWQKLNLPHDWSIEGDFSEENPAGIGAGALPCGIGWYRKTFEILPEKINSNYFITFDGIYMNSTVYVNGQIVGTRPNGYVSFQYDITPYIHEGKNVIAVRVDNHEQPNSRWYSGSGIYRNVWLTRTSDIYVDNWGTYITTPLVNRAKADVNIETTIRNKHQFNSDIEIKTIIVDKKGKEIAKAKQKLIAKAEKQSTVNQHLRIATPELWTLENPYQYKVITELYEKDVLLDRYETKFGIRSYYFDADEGFILNDKLVKINGVCMHHDLGCLGTAINNRAIERRLQILKEMGCNAIRCTHNPPAPELLNMCDSLGFVVIDEAFDAWRQKKVEYDYSQYFDEWYERDLSDMILRDRNHPSIYIWSIGNEVQEQWPLVNDMSQSTSDSIQVTSNVNLCQNISSIVRRLDPTRPITAGCNEPSINNNLFKSNALDIIGYNYHESEFEKVPSNFHGKPFIVTESVSALMTRGYYRMPSDADIIWPESWDKTTSDLTLSCSAYDNCHTPWGSSHELNLVYIQNLKYISGQFVWSGFDYIGEPTPFGWPARSSYFGINDLAGFHKDIYYLYQSEWQTDKNVLHLFPHWSWKDGDVVDMWCYYNNADEVELFVNGESRGIQRKDSLKYHCAWSVEYQPGEVSVISRKDGKKVAERTIKTAGRPDKIRLTADRQRIHADGEDLSFITVEVVDAEGTLCPKAENEITFEIEGTGIIAGVDNGSPISMERFKDNHRRAFYGKCLVVLQNNGEAGNIRIKAKSDGLNTGELTINCLKDNQY